MSHAVFRVGILALAGSTASATQLAVLTPPEEDRSGSRGQFGWTVAVDDGVVLVGGGSGRTGSRGDAFAFDLQSGGGRTDMLLEEVRQARRSTAVALEGNLAVVGEPLGFGYASVFNATTGERLADLSPQTDSSVLDFGRSVSLADGVAVVGAPESNRYEGTAYLFQADTGEQLAELMPSTPGLFGLFGYAAAMSRTHVIVGEPAGTPAVRSGVPGKAYLFDAETGDARGVLDPVDGMSGDRFGASVAVNGEIALVGAPGNSSAYLFDVENGDELGRLTPEDPSEAPGFGAAVALWNDYALVASATFPLGGPVVPREGDDFGVSAYLFDVNSGVQLAKYTPTGAPSFGPFHVSVALADGLVVVGSPYMVGPGDATFSAAYVFEVVPEPAACWLLTLGLVSPLLSRRRL